MKTICVAIQKGGVGKTVTSLALTAWLHNKGYKTLLIDMDSQGNASITVGADRTGETVLDLLKGNTTANRVVQETEIGDVIPSHKNLASDKPVGIDKLKKALEAVAPQYDYCIIDCNPALDVLTINSLCASDGVLIPMKADRYSLEALTDFMDTFTQVTEVNPKLKLLGCVITQYNYRSTINKVVLDEIAQEAKQYKARIYEPYIRRCVTLEESQYIPNIFTYAPRSNASIDYDQVFAQVMKKL